MKKPTDMGTNRSGIGTSPVDSKRLMEGAVEGVPSATVSADALMRVRAELSRDADPVGTMPPPASIKGAVKTVVEGLKGQKATVFLDQMAERLAFERTGTRLYEALISKLAGADAHPGGPTAAELAQIREDELAHFHLLAQAIASMGGDPTAVTPSADISAVASSGLVQVLADPRTTLNEALKTVLIAELADNEAWRNLTELASRLGQDELAEQFQTAAQEEEEHLALLRDWVADGIQGEAGLEPSADAARAP
jgi:ferritin-like protein